ncbi:DUF7691 family protein [Nocardia tengchongensis]|uniref:DUF7691 family protein n=1 Tax=Nocardia tengchongensis TaxID=2055889 RepID=UPI0036661F56
MGYVMEVYLGDMAQLEAVIGSKDDALLSRILEAGGGGVEPEIFRAIVNGGPFTDDDADDYTAAMEFLCLHLGGENIASVEFSFGDDPDITDLFYDWAFEDQLPEPESSGCGTWSKESAAEHLDEWLEDSGADFIDQDSGEMDWDEVRQDTWWANQSKVAGKDLFFFWGGLNCD